MIRGAASSPPFSPSKSELWDSQDDDYALHADPRTDMSHCLWDEVNQDEDSLLYMLEEQTPIKDTELTYHAFNMEGIGDKTPAECRVSSQSKRRRVLQFDSEINDITICNEQFTDIISNSKTDEESLLDAVLHDDMQWFPGFSDNKNAVKHGGLHQSSEGWLPNCVSDREINLCSEEMISCDAFQGQIDISEICGVPSEEHVSYRQAATPSPRIKIKAGRKSVIDTPTKSTSVAYPFALIKPCGDKGDVTLKDINKRIHSPLRSSMKNGESSLWYPTSAFSGKPVVAKTKIRTEGGKGSITIMRTKG